MTRASGETPAAVVPCDERAHLGDERRRVMILIGYGRLMVPTPSDSDESALHLKVQLCLRQAVRTIGQLSFDPIFLHV